MRSKKTQKHKLICFCNGIDQVAIQNAIKDGAQTLDEIFDRTNAGVGACGGSCRPYLKLLLDGYIQNGEFPEIQRSKRKK